MAVSSARKKFDALVSEIADEMDDEQLAAYTKALRLSTQTKGSSDAEEEEAEVEEDEDEDEAPAKKSGKKGKKVEVEEEDEDEDEAPVKKSGKKGKKVEVEEEDEDEDSSDEVDYSSKSVPALKKLGADVGLNVKAIIKKGGDEKKALVKALKAFDGNVALLKKKKLTSLLSLAEKHEVVYAKPRGKSGDDKKIDAAARALAAAGWPFE